MFWGKIYCDNWYAVLHCRVQTQKISFTHHFDLNTLNFLKKIRLNKKFLFIINLVWYAWVEQTDLAKTSSSHLQYTLVTYNHLLFLKEQNPFWQREVKKWYISNISSGWWRWCFWSGFWQLNRMLTCMATCVLDSNKNANAVWITGLTTEIVSLWF